MSDLLRRVRHASRLDKGTAAAFLALVLTAAGLTWYTVSLPEPGPKYTNISRNFKACLVSTSAQPEVWQAIQAATGRSAINAQRLTAPVGTTEELRPYVNGLLALQCQLIVAAGA
jgi:hypothetical protein